jgi:hypothetical protein
MEVVVQKNASQTHPSASYYVLKGQSTQWLFKKESRRPKKMQAKGASQDATSKWQRGSFEHPNPSQVVTLFLLRAGV